MFEKPIFDAINAVAPLNLCDSCVAKEVGASTADAQRVTDAFGITSDFKRYPGHCSRCGKDRMVTRAAG
jgi:hypothetical protein